MNCAFATAAGVLWLCVLRESAAPAGVRPLLQTPGGRLASRIVGSAFLLMGVWCWIATRGIGLGISLTLVTVMIVGAIATFLVPTQRNSLTAALVLCLLAWLGTLLTN